MEIVAVSDSEASAWSSAECPVEHVLVSSVHVGDLYTFGWWTLKVKHVLMPPMDDRTLRIVTTALELAEKDGFDAVRLRDVAAKADVALGTVYRRFPTKEDILVAALEVQMERLALLIQDHPVTGDTAVERTASCFDVMTKLLISKPALARALLRAVASGVPENTERIAQFHGTTTSVIAAMMFDLDRGDAAWHEVLAGLLQDIWFASLVGWAGGLHGPEKVVTDMKLATELLLNAPIPEGAAG